MQNCTKAAATPEPTCHKHARPPTHLVEAAEAALRVAPHHQHALRAHWLDQRRLAVGRQVGRKL